MHALRPEPLERARLGEALAGVAERWSALHGIAVEVTTTGTARPLPPEAELALLRTAQEALANVAKHAQATRVGLTLSYMDHEVALDVRDDGGGFDPAGPAPHGLRAPAADDCRDRRRRSRATRRGHGRHAAGSGWSRCGSGSRACPARCRSSRSRAAGRRSRPASRPRRRGTAQPEAPAPAATGGSARDGAPIRLLIVDDHPVVRDGLTGMFARDPEFEVLGRGGRRRRGGPARRGPAGPT